LHISAGFVKEKRGKKILGKNHRKRPMAMPPKENGAYI
jgi:hypothetical protein